VLHCRSQRNIGLAAYSSGTNLFFLPEHSILSASFYIHLFDLKPRMLTKLHSRGIASLEKAKGKTI
jgi:hypothetical protein